MLGRSESAYESLFRVLVFLAGLPAPELRCVIRQDGCFIARTDGAWPRRRVAAEIDGFAYHVDGTAFARDRADKTRW